MSRLPFRAHPDALACRALARRAFPRGGRACDGESASRFRRGRGFAYRLDLPRPQRWSCESPHLYRLVTESGKAARHRSPRHRLRHARLRGADGQFFLNDEPIYLRGVLLQPNYPVGLVAPPTREMMEREIT